MGKHSYKSRYFLTSSFTDVSLVPTCLVYFLMFNFHPFSYITPYSPLQCLNFWKLLWSNVSRSRSSFSIINQFVQFSSTPLLIPQRTSARRRCTVIFRAFGSISQVVRLRFTRIRIFSRFYGKWEFLGSYTFYSFTI